MVFEHKRTLEVGFHTSNTGGASNGAATKTGEPLYSCVVPIDSFTANQDEEIVTFSVSSNEAKNKAEQLL